MKWERKWERTLLAAARWCSALLDSDLGLWDKPHVGGVVVTILTSGCRRRVNAVPMPAGENVQ
jgi:hypothetical protein